MAGLTSTGQVLGVAEQERLKKYVREEAFNILRERENQKRN